MDKYETKQTFTFTHKWECGDGEKNSVTLTTNIENRDQVIQEFVHFLRGCGYQCRGLEEEEAE